MTVIFVGKVPKLNSSSGSCVAAGILLRFIPTERLQLRKYLAKQDNIPTEQFFCDSPDYKIEIAKNDVTLLLLRTAVVLHATI